MPSREQLMAAVAPVCSGSAVEEQLLSETFCLFCHVTRSNVSGVSGGGGGREEGGQVFSYCSLPG